MVNSITTWMRSYFTYRDGARVFEDIGLWRTDEVSVTGLGEPEQVQALSVTAGTLPLLRARPVLGRLSRQGEDSADAPHRALLSHRYWQRAFGGARDVVGRSLTIDAMSYEIIGVLATVALLATYLPARRASRIDPIIALRSEM